MTSIIFRSVTEPTLEYKECASPGAQIAGDRYWETYTMSNVPEDTIMRRSAFAWVALATGIILLIPLIAMQFTTEVDWSAADFAVMGLLVFCTGSVFVLLSRKFARKYRFAIGAIVAVVLGYVWIELAVGVFANLGS